MSDPPPTTAPPADPSVQSDPVELSTPYTLSRALIARRKEYVRPRSVRIKIGTWNVAACPGTDKDLATWFLDNEGIDKDLNVLDLSQATAVRESRTQRAEVGLYVLGLQEVVDLNMTKEYMARAVYTDKSATIKWQAAIEAALPKGYELVVAEQMFGILLLIYASSEIAPTITNVSTKQVGTGLGGWFTNKGAISTRLVIGETTSLVFLNSHLASGVTPANLERRCADAAQIVQKTQFDPIVTAGVKEGVGDNIGDEDFVFWFGDLNYRLDGLPGDDIRRILTLHARGEYAPADDRDDTSAPEGEGIIIIGDSDTEDDATTVASSQQSRNPSFENPSFEPSPTLPDPDDFAEDPSQDPTSLQATLNSLLPHDQLAKMIRGKKAFHDGWREGPISFLPTYKYDLGTVGLFDTSEKQRAPSWCDRVLYRTRRDKEAYDKKAAEEKEVEKKDAEMKQRGIEDDEDVLFTYDPDADGEDAAPEPAEDVVPADKLSNAGFDEYDEYDENEDGEGGDLTDPITLEFYTSHQRITSSDHKPVSASFSIQYDAVVPELKAFIHSEVARELDRAENEGRPSITVVAETQDSGENVVDMGDIQYLESKTRYMTIANTGGVPATFSFVDNPLGVDESAESTPKPSAKWLTTSFARSDHTGHADTSGEPLAKSVTLEPGETIFALLTVHVKSNSVLRDLNSGKITIEEVLIMRVEDGKDHFITVRGDWLPSCFGRSVDELIRVPDGGIRSFVTEWHIKGSVPMDAEQKFSAPKELFNIIAAMESLTERCIADAAMLEDMKIPKDPGWPLDPLTWTASSDVLEPLLAGLAEALDTDKPLLQTFPIETPSTHRLEALSSILVRFVSSLTDGLVPKFLWIGLAPVLPATLPPKISDIKTKILDCLTASPTHNISFVFLTTALARISAELNPVNKSQPPANTLQRRFSLRRQPSTAVAAGLEARRKRRATEKRFAEILGPRVCRTGMDSSQKDKVTKEKERIMLEACIRPDEESS
ncbi:unnamed protein product [Clonostachys rosea]|uniref:Inositol polyphosphate-related phosphatase domain-containing protein n=1 Tax=Bionectria ochroleuca TaxID=29856 RepID=A0ABY6TST3_BIOOC|nr:unnamed protein product [Clonostachys rosea]